MRAVAKTKEMENDKKKSNGEILELVSEENIRKGEKALVPFNIGDTVKVHVIIAEEKRKEADSRKAGKAAKTKPKKVGERVQVFEGTVIGFYNSGIRKTFKVRKISYNVGVERTFPYHSPMVKKVEVVRRGKIRRAKLYYLRGRRGKAAQVKRLDNY